MCCDIATELPYIATGKVTLQRRRLSCNTEVDIATRNVESQQGSRSCNAEGCIATGKLVLDRTNSPAPSGLGRVGVGTFEPRASAYGLSPGLGSQPPSEAGGFSETRAPQGRPLRQLQQIAFRALT